MKENLTDLADCKFLFGLLVLQPVSERVGLGDGMQSAGLFLSHVAFIGSRIFQNKLRRE